MFDPKQYLSDPKSMNGTTWDSRHLDKFLRNSNWAQNSIKISNQETRQAPPTAGGRYKTQSSVLPCDFSQTNHFGRENRHDLLPEQAYFSTQSHLLPKHSKQLSGQIVPSKQTITPIKPKPQQQQQYRDLMQSNYVSENSATEAKRYYRNLVSQRTRQQRKEHMKQSIRRAQTIKNCFKSGVLGYQSTILDKSGSKVFEQKHQPHHKRIQAYPVCKAAQTSFRHTYDQKPENPANTKKDNYVFNNILASTGQIKIKKQRTDNILKNQQRRNYNFLNMEVYK